jgi:hypothetical protein
MDVGSINRGLMKNVHRFYVKGSRLKCHSNLDNLKNVRREASRRFRNKKRGYLKAKINE